MTSDIDYRAIIDEFVGIVKEDAKSTLEKLKDAGDIEAVTNIAIEIGKITIKLIQEDDAVQRLKYLAAIESYRNALAFYKGITAIAVAGITARAIGTAIALAGKAAAKVII